jgi:hypothetical protein
MNLVIPLLTQIEIDALSQRHLIGEIDGTSAPSDVLFPRVPSRFATPVRTNRQKTES